MLTSHTHTQTAFISRYCIYCCGCSITADSQMYAEDMYLVLWLSSESPHIVIETAPSGRFDVQREIYFIVRFEFRLFTQLVFKCQRLKHVPKRSLMWQTHTHTHTNTHTYVPKFGTRFSCFYVERGRGIYTHHFLYFFMFGEGVDRTQRDTCAYIVFNMYTIIYIYSMLSS